MNKTLSTILIVLAVLVLAGGIFFAGKVYARANAFGPGWMTLAPDASAGVGGYSRNNNGTYGPGGMMGGNGGMMSMMNMVGGWHVEHQWLQRTGLPSYLAWYIHRRI